MKILVTAPYDMENEYVANLVKSLRYTDHSITCSVDEFWLKDGSYDLIYLQWPELLFQWKIPNEHEITELGTVLQHWKNRGVQIIAARHNIFPHRNSSIDHTLYKLVFEHCDAIVHFGSFSLDDFMDRYPGLNMRHAIIPHPRYEQKNELNKREAREKLGMDSDVSFYFAMGNIRYFEEQEMLIRAFEQLTIPRKYLYIPNGRLKEDKPTGLFNIFSRRLWKIRFWLYNRRLKKEHIEINRRFLPHDTLYCYTKACDVVIIPRIDTLNSGVLHYGFSHGKVVIGPACGNIQEILQDSNNPMFNPENSDTIVEAMMKGIQLEEKGKGLDNLAYAKRRWHYNRIGKLHNDLFESLFNGLSESSAN